MSDSNLNFIGASDAERHPERGGEIEPMDYSDDLRIAANRWRAFRWLCVAAVLAVVYWSWI